MTDWLLLLLGQTMTQLTVSLWAFSIVHANIQDGQKCTVMTFLIYFQNTSQKCNSCSFYEFCILLWIL